MARIADSPPFYHGSLSMWKWVVYLIIAVWMSLEVLLFNQVSPWLGLFGTLAWMLGSALVGLILLRQQGSQSLFRVFEHLRREEFPAREMMNMGLILVGCVTLILPGFFSDIVGGLLLLPPLRSLILSAFRFKNSGTPVVHPLIVEITPDQIERDIPAHS